MKFSKRISQIVSYAKNAKRVCDIGCDHGLVGILLINDYKIKHVIFSDILNLPLQSAIDNVSKYNIDRSAVEFRIGDGLQCISNGEVDTVIISGMGGKLITSILSYDLEKTRSFTQFVLQPTNSESELRTWLNIHDFTLIKESLIEEDGIYYETFLVTHGSQYLTSQQLKFGKYIDYNNKEFIDKYDCILDKLEGIKSNIPSKYKSEHQKFDEEINEIKSVLNRK